MRSVNAHPHLLNSMVAVALGGVVGCLVRWLLSLALNRYFPLIPPGTLAANLIGGYIIGAAFAIFTLHPAMPVEWRLFVMTGFCGGLTTFSTFSVEVVLLAVALGHGHDRRPSRRFIADDVRRHR